MQMERWLRERKDLDPSGKTTTRNWPLKINFSNTEEKTRERVFHVSENRRWEHVACSWGGATPTQLQHCHPLPPGLKRKAGESLSSFATTPNANDLVEDPDCNF